VVLFDKLFGPTRAFSRASSGSLAISAAIRRALSRGLLLAILSANAVTLIGVMLVASLLAHLYYK